MAVANADIQSHHHIHQDAQQWLDRMSARGQRNGQVGQDSDGDSGNQSESRFTPSSASGSQDPQSNPGTYQINQVDLFSAAALLVLGQPGSSSPSQSAGSPASSAPTTSTPAVTSTGAAPATTPASGTTSTPSTDSSSTSSSTDPLQALNSTLQSLGLSQQQIQEFDQVASFINSVSPAAFTDLVNQLQSLAQQSSAGSPNVSGVSANSAPAASSDAASVSTPSTVTPSVTTTSTPASTGAAPSGSYQIEELSIRFSGVDVQGSTGNTSGNNASGNTTGGTFDFSAFKLNIQEVNVTLTDNTGQTAQITASQQPTASGTSTQPSSTPSAATTT